jgi:MFS family permease
VRTYEQLFFCRVLTGISVGGATPVIFSMIGDMYPGESRIYASTLVGVSFSAGVAGGQLLAGFVGPSLGWRMPFLLVAIPALFCAVVVLFTVKEPSRGDQEQAMRALRESRSLAREDPSYQVRLTEGESLLLPTTAPPDSTAHLCTSTTHLYSSTPLYLFNSAPLLLYSSTPLLLYSSTHLRN